MQEEIWKKIFTQYEVSNLGNVRRVNKDKRCAKYKNLVKNEDTLGYYHVNVGEKGNHKLFLVHRLVAKAFIPNPNNYPIINHIDCNPKNNRVENLEWCTYRYNTQYAFKLGRLKNANKGKRGSEVKWAKKVNQYDLQGNFIKTWNSIIEASRELKIDNGAITKCCKNVRHKAGNYRWEYLKEEEK